MTPRVHVLLRVPGNTTQTQIDQMALEYGMWDVRVHDFSMYRGRCRIVAATLGVRSLWRLGKECTLVTDCSPNNVITLKGVGEP